MPAVLRLVVGWLALSLVSAEVAAQPAQRGGETGERRNHSFRDGLAHAQQRSARSSAGVLTPAARFRCSPSSDGDGDDPATTSALTASKDFVAGSFFLESLSPAREVRISWLGANFARRFAVKVERYAATPSLRAYTLNRLSRSIGIAEELDPPFDIRLADVWCLLKRQPNGEAGALLTNAIPNLFFVRDVAGEVGVVDVVWSGAGWEVGASSLTRNRPWPAGLRVIAR